MDLVTSIAVNVNHMGLNVTVKSRTEAELYA